MKIIRQDGTIMNLFFLLKNIIFQPNLARFSQEKNILRAHLTTTGVYQGAL